MLREAVLSDCERYRYRLTRVWDRDLPRDVWVMLNPSTADADLDDPTIRRCMGFSRGWGRGGIEVVNLFPWRATKPADLVTALQSGRDIRRKVARDHYITVAMRAAKDGHVIAAWGANKLAAVENLIWFPPMLCLGTTNSGAPKHPLYLPKTTQLQPWGKP